MAEARPGRHGDTDVRERECVSMVTAASSLDGDRADHRVVHQTAVFVARDRALAGLRERHRELADIARDGHRVGIGPTTPKPWITSPLVSRNVTGTCAGTSIGSGANAYIVATTGTTTLPSSRVVTAGCPNSGCVASVSGSTVSTWLGG